VVKQIWTSRRLLSFLFLRTARRLYRRTVLGWTWLFILPLFPLVLKVLVFGTIMGLPLVGPSYFVFLIAGQICWDLFEGALSWGTRGLSLHGKLQAMRVPRVIMPLGSTAPAVIELFINGSILLVSLAYVAVRRGVATGPEGLGVAVLSAGAALSVAFLMAIGLALFTSILGEETRDMRFLISQITPVWYLLTPIVYPLSSVPESWRRWMILNPMTGVVETFKYAVLGEGTATYGALAISAGEAALITCLGLWFFARRDAAALDEA
jgi:lipopolysaccharide transport system permease protein